MTVEFIADRGFKLSNAGRSLLLKSIIIGKDNAFLTDRQILQGAEAFFGYDDDINERGYLPNKRVSITPTEAPPIAEADVAYKFTDDSAVKFWIDGSIRLNPLQFYHNIENVNAMDVREGLGMVHLDSPARFAELLSGSGFNSLVICASSDARKSERAIRHKKFGSRLLRINRVTEFAQKIASRIGAKRFAVRDVNYSDLKVVKGVSHFPDTFLGVHGSGDLKKATLEAIAVNHLDELIEATEAASVFTKPNSFRIERERRLLFVMDKDVTGWTSVQDKALAEHIEVIV
ncbi:hypothetical protein HJC06_28540 [Rhizobium sp. NLR9b]|uniref:hypothetical protein n=1 Tax=unclassified Rhizobium TaxID=2613769 RepID=UPI001C82E5B1|nr:MULTISPECIES: hypothetical protein [unclassified Rhizobium]MBX5230310.1 hypothetical protein [Rhizobium sp. NLR9b]MBX5290979.1 hypothetical protein [Rhizobium sp. NLR10b]